MNKWWATKTRYLPPTRKNLIQIEQRMVGLKNPLPAPYKKKFNSK